MMGIYLVFRYTSALIKILSFTNYVVFGKLIILYVALIPQP